MSELTTIQEFFEKHEELELTLRRTSTLGGGWFIRVHNLLSNYILNYIISDEELSSANEDFEMLIMRPIIRTFGEKEEKG